MPDVRAYLSGRLSPHRPTTGRQTEEKQMFTTDSFLGAEIKYRQEKVRKDYQSRSWIRRNDPIQK